MTPGQRVGRGVAALFVAVPIAAAGCTEDGGGRPDGVEAGIVVWTEPITDELDAPVRGLVTIGDDGCVLLADEQGQFPGVVAIWPYGTTYDGKVIRTTAGVEVRHGDIVRGGGGGVAIEDYYVDNTTLSFDPAIVEDCGRGDGQGLSAFNALSPIEVVAGVPARAAAAMRQLVEIFEVAVDSECGALSPAQLIASLNAAYEADIRSLDEDLRQALFAEIQGINVGDVTAWYASGCASS